MTIDQMLVWIGMAGLVLATIFITGVIIADRRRNKRLKRKILELLADGDPRALSGLHDAMPEEPSACIYIATTELEEERLISCEGRARGPLWHKITAEGRSFLDHNP